MVIPLPSFLANFYYDDWQTLMFEPFVVVTGLAQRGTDQVHWSRGLCFDFSRLQCREWPCRDWPTHVTSDQGGGGPTGRAWGLSTQLHTASYKDICKAYICKQWFFNQFLIFLGFLFTLLDGILAGVDGILAGVDGILASSRFSCSCDILSFSQILPKTCVFDKTRGKSVRFLGSGRARKVKIKGTHDHQQKAYAFLVPAEQKL